MTRQLLKLITAGLLFALISPASADDVFGADDTGEPGQIVVPGGSSAVTAEMLRQYETAINAARNSGDANLAQQLQEQLLPGQPVTPANQALDGFPFSLLSNELDRDRDGLSNTDEIQIKSNPNLSDTDQDTYSDGVEVVRGYNPLQPSPGDKISYQQPGDDPINTYQVTGVRLAKHQNQSLMTITGIAPPSSMLAILIFPSRQFWITRSDVSGRFIYTSAKLLDIGDHTIYASAVSADGNSLEYSLPYQARRLDDTISLIKPLVDETNNTNNTGVEDKWPLALISSIIFPVLLIFILFGTWIIWRRRKAQTI